MKKVLLFAVLVSLVGVTQAQQTVVRKPAATAEWNSQSVAPKPVPFRAEPTSVTIPMKPKSKGTPRIQNDLFEIGFMANTFGSLGDNRLQVACDPSTNMVAIVHRGNDRSPTAVGNTVLVRYSSDHGASWTAAGTNVANTAGPRYPQITLYNQNASTNINDVKATVLWPQSINYPSGTPTWGDVNLVQMGFDGANKQYSKFPTPPMWLIPNKIVPDYVHGKLYTSATALEPSNGASLGEIHLLSSADGGKTWAPVNIDVPLYDNTLEQTGYFISNLRFDVSPDGSTMMLAWALIEETSPGSGSALLLSENHGVGYRLSTDGGNSWGPVQTISLIDVPNLPVPLNGAPKMTWDLDALLDANNNPHFLVFGSTDLNPFSPFDEAPTDSTISLSHVDSTFAVELTKKNGTWEANLIGRVLRVRTDRRSYSTKGTDGVDRSEVFRNEPHLARSLDGNKVYAKWTTPNQTWTISDVAGQPTLFSDTVRNVWVSGRDIRSNTAGGGWLSEPLMVTDNGPDNENLDAKYTKMAHFAGNGGELHIIFTEWGIGERRDEDANNTDNTIWYIKDVKVGTTVAVDRVDANPGAFALSQNYPNPFNPATSISFTLPEAGMTTLRVFNVLGQQVASLVNEMLPAGTHKSIFDARALPSGVYVYRLESGSLSASRTMTLAK